MFDPNHDPSVSSKIVQFTPFQRTGKVQTVKISPGNDDDDGVA